MVEVNHAGIARSARAMDDEGCFLLLRTKVRYEVGVLDAVVPPDGGTARRTGAGSKRSRGGCCCWKGSRTSGTRSSRTWCPGCRQQVSTRGR